MKRTYAFAFAVIVAAAVTHGAAAQSNSQQTSRQSGTAPPPVAVEVVSVDPQAKTITVRDIAAVPVTPGKAVEITLPVPANAGGERLNDVKAGQKVDVTCNVKPTVHPTAGVPVVLTDCASVMRIEPSSK